MRKARPAVIINSDAAGRMLLRLIVPLTGWQEAFANYFWMTRIEPTRSNNLQKTSAADAFQMRGADVGRFKGRIGVLPQDVLDQITQAIAVTIELNT